MHDRPNPTPIDVMNELLLMLGALNNDRELSDDEIAALRWLADQNYETTVRPIESAIHKARCAWRRERS